MLFNSLHFLIFFPIVLIAHFLVPHRYRWALLLAGSYYFYMCWRANYLLLIIGATLVVYVCGLQIEKTQNQKARKGYLIACLVSCLGVLFAYKYFNLLSDTTTGIFRLFHIDYRAPALRVLLPVGISFYTFQALSYALDVYRGKIRAERHLGIFALYVAFFPQLVAGPIERSTRLLPQFRVEKTFDYDRFIGGVTLMLWGFVKKVVIADRLAIYVNAVYNNPQQHEGLPLILATYFFAFQIFCDFSAYSDIAIGAAQTMGFKLMDNFHAPYFSRSIPEFWRRWHISLSTWFRDYVYVPLGGNRTSLPRWCMIIMIVFAVSGLWHGANWTFVVWGCIHGGFMIASRLTAGIRKRFAVWVRLERLPALHTALNILVTFHIVLAAWVFFRANSLSEALLIFRSAFAAPLRLTDAGIPGFGKIWIMIVLLMIGLMEIVNVVQTRTSPTYFFCRHPIHVRWPVYIGASLLIAFLGVFEHTAFIYFQF